MKTYQVTAERTGKWWVLQAEAAPGAISQVSRLDQADQIIEAISFVTGEPESEIDINVTPVLSPEVLHHLAEVKRLRELSKRANTQAAEQARAAARALKEADITVRDIGQIMSVSHQRAAQLAS